MFKQEMQVFVFDLDFTIWNAGDTFCSETNPPYLWEDGRLVDRAGRWIRVYPDALEILQMLRDKGKIIALASRTNEPPWAMQLLQIFDLDKYFDIKEIYPGNKREHLIKIREKVNCPFDQIVFFDDEERNIEAVKSLGVASVLVNSGISLEIVNQFKDHIR
jgi:magnesium-dependent phosphatase 1